MSDIQVSVCIPVYRGEKTITSLVAALEQALQKYTFEIILVNDASPDSSGLVCEELSKKYRFVRYAWLRRNFGEHNAVMCALNMSMGDCAVIMDDDFQNPPEEVPKLVDALYNEDHDVVYTRYEKKKHNFFRNLGSRFNDRVATWLLNKPPDLYLSSFKALKKSLVAEIIKYKGPFPYVDGLILRVTDHIGVIDSAHSPRIIGKSNYTIKKLFSLYLNMFINFSIKPLRMFTFSGVFLACTGFVATVILAVLRFCFPTSGWSLETPMGWTSLICALFFFSGIQILFLGLLGEYLGKLYLDVNGCPQWTVYKKSE